MSQQQRLTMERKLDDATVTMEKWVEESRADDGFVHFPGIHDEFSDESSNDDECDDAGMIQGYQEARKLADYLIQPPLAQRQRLPPLNADANATEWLQKKIDAFKKSERTSDFEGKRMTIPLCKKDSLCELYRQGYSFEVVQQQAAAIFPARIFLQSKFQLAQWIKNQVTRQRVSTNRPCKKRLREEGGGRRGKYKKLGSELLSWFIGERMAEKIVRKADLKAQSEILFKAIVEEGELSSRWIEKWRMKHDIVLRAIKRKTVLTPDARIKFAQKFHQFIALWTQCNCVVNLDEIPVSLCGSMGTCQKTYELRGVEDVICRADSNFTKRAATFLPVACWDFKNDCAIDIPPILIHKTAIKKIPVSASHGLVNINNASGVVDGDLMADVVMPHVLSHIKSTKSLIVLDSARSHLTKRVLSTIRDAGQVPIVVPPGMTMFLQFIDVDYASKLKRAHFDLFRNEFGDTPTLTASDARTALAYLLSKSHAKVMQETDLKQSFISLGYINPTTESIRLRSIPDYTFERDSSAKPQVHPNRKSTPKSLFDYWHREELQSDSQHVRIEEREA